MDVTQSEVKLNGLKIKEIEGTENFSLRIFQSTLNLLAHILIGIVVGVCMMFGFRYGVPLRDTNLHIVLCVLGYQLLMAEGFLALCPHNSWTAGLKWAHKKWTHTILQIMGSTLGIVGSLFKTFNKTTNFNTLHGKFALISMVFTILSLINGLTSLYAHELRKYIPANFSKITHSIFGILAFVMSLISLCYGCNYSFFKNWTGVERSSGDQQHHGFAYAMMAMSAIFTFIIIINPIITVCNKTYKIFK